jgi:hypothetical protein
MNLQTVVTVLLLGALVYLWLTVNRLREAVRVLEQRALPPAPVIPSPAAPAPAMPAPPAEKTLDVGVLAAIAAAVAVVVRQPHRIIAVQSDSGAQRAWSAEGRREIYHSHRVR